MEPITTELREFVASKIPVFYIELHDQFRDLCDAIDAVHARLEQENDELRTHHRLSGEITGDDLLRMFAWLYSHALAGDAS